MAAGRTLSYALAAKRFDIAEKAFLALEVGLGSVQENGKLPSDVPAHIKKGRILSIGDEASGAAFFLSAACPALGTLKEAGQQVISRSRIHHAASKVRKAITWLHQHTSLLMKYDGKAPNRLLFDALAFYSCGRFLSLEKIEQTPSRFVEAALSLTHPEGYFLEGNGWDTNYQGVAINQSLELLRLGYRHKSLRNFTKRAVSWLHRRIDSKGRIDSSGNRRTCANENFLGRTKKVNPITVFFALGQSAVYFDNAEWRQSATQLSRWILRRRNVDPCFFGAGNRFR